MRWVARKSDNLSTIFDLVIALKKLRIGVINLISPFGTWCSHKFRVLLLNLIVSDVWEVPHANQSYLNFFFR